MEDPHDVKPFVIVTPKVADITRQFYNSNSKVTNEKS